LIAIFMIAQLAFIGMWIYVLYLYLTPIIYGFTSNPTASPPAYCDRVIGSVVAVPTQNNDYCQEVDTRWRTDVGVVAASILPMLLSVMFGSCLLAGFKIWLAREMVRAQERHNAKVLAEQEAQKVQLNQLAASNAQLQQQVTQLAQQPMMVPAPGPIAAPAGVVPGQTVYAPIAPGSTQHVQYVAVQAVPPPGQPGTIPPPGQPAQVYAPPPAN